MSSPRENNEGTPTTLAYYRRCYQESNFSALFFIEGPVLKILEKKILRNTYAPLHIAYFAIGFTYHPSLPNFPT